MVECHGKHDVECRDVAAAAAAASASASASAIWWVAPPIYTMSLTHATSMNPTPSLILETDLYLE